MLWKDRVRCFIFPLIFHLLSKTLPSMWNLLNLNQLTLAVDSSCIETISETASKSNFALVDFDLHHFMTCFTSSSFGAEQDCFSPPFMTDVRQMCTMLEILPKFLRKLERWKRFYKERSLNDMMMNLLTSQSTFSQPFMCRKRDWKVSHATSNLSLAA